MAEAFWFVYIVSAVILGIVVGFIGREKGRSGWGWFWAGLFLSLIGLIAVCAVPRLEKQVSERQLADEPSDAGLGSWLRGGKASLGMKIALAIGASLLLAFVLFACTKSCSQYAEDQRAAVGAARNLTESLQAKPAAAPASPAVWRTVARWSGNGMKQTQTFSIRSSEWRISWKTTREAFAGAGILQVYVYGAAGELVSLAANRQGVGSDVSYVHAQPGRFYLDIGSANVDWEVVVEDRY